MAVQGLVQGQTREMYLFGLTFITYFIAMGVVEAATTGGSSFGELLRLEAFINPNFLETFSVNPSLTSRGKWKFKPAMFSSK